jgi:lactoylglutathione lyase
MELTQIRLLVSDFPAVYRFYRDVLGLKPQFEAENGPYTKLSPDTGHAAIALQDRAQMTDVLTACGADFTWAPVPMGDRMRVAYLEDPEGNRIELQEWLALREQAGG